MLARFHPSSRQALVDAITRFIAAQSVRLDVITVEGLSHFRDESCAVEMAVQTDAFEDSPLGVVIGGEPISSGHFPSDARG